MFNLAWKEIKCHELLWWALRFPVIMNILRIYQKIQKKCSNSNDEPDNIMYLFAYIREMFNYQLKIIYDILRLAAANILCFSSIFFLFIKLGFNMIRPRVLLKCIAYSKTGNNSFLSLVSHLCDINMVFSYVIYMNTHKQKHTHVFTYIYVYKPVYNLPFNFNYYRFPNFIDVYEACCMPEGTHKLYGSSLSK